ncbi:MAG: hypothetical protein IKY30_04870, partial [Oscillospiraceae bacterium]|nr:hypothetical protein [Oscillospiraceae bacterium]
MIQYYFDRNNLEKSVVEVDLMDSSDIENLVADIYEMITTVIDCVATRYIDENWQRRFAEELKEMLADILYENDI